MAVRVGVQVQPQQGSFTAMRDAWLRAEELGVDAIYNWDHFYPLYGDPDGEHYECWTTLAALAEATERPEVGALVVCNSYRNPNLVADMARTVDHISGGRLVLGLGAGWFQRDYDEYGYDFGTAPSRLRQLDAAMPVILERLGRLNPPPVHRIPIMIGGGGEKVTLRITAQYADRWNGSGDPDVIRHKARVLAGHCERLGRDPAEIDLTVTNITAANVGRLDEYVAAGVRELIVPTGGPDWDLSVVRDVLARRA